MASRLAGGRSAGELVVVGSGISLVGQVTIESEKAIRAADEVLYVVPNRPTELWIQKLNPRTSSLSDTYQAGRTRRASYREMTARMVARVEAGRRVCVVFYGHPGVLAQATHAAIRRLRRLGYSARMLPGVSADACLFADLGVNPGDQGCQSYEATDFLAFRRRTDPTSGLILWQLGVIGEWTARGNLPARPDRVRALVSRLRRQYPAGHKVVLYVASTLPHMTPFIRRVRLDRLAAQKIVAPMTLFVPALRNRQPDPRVHRWLTSP